MLNSALYDIFKHSKDLVIETSRSGRMSIKIKIGKNGDYKTLLNDPQFFFDDTTPDERAKAVKAILYQALDFGKKFESSAIQSLESEEMIKSEETPKDENVLNEERIKKIISNIREGR